jgi:sulfopyruvate decarboxylase TPP-binding subunit
MRQSSTVLISNRFTALENLEADVHINRASENIREKIKISIV